VRYFFELVVGISNYIEKVLWILESFLQIHLTKVRIMPVYKGKSGSAYRNNQFTNDTDGNTTIGFNDDVDDNFDADSTLAPDWRLTLAFSGHCLLFGVLPIPFINVVLPTFIIPQPHALLEYLLSKQPLASAKLKRENIAEQKIAISFLDMAEEWNSRVQLCATPPAVGIDLTLPGGVSLGMEILHGRDFGAGKSRGETLNNGRGPDFVGLGGGFQYPQTDSFSVRETATATPAGFASPAAATPTAATQSQNAGAGAGMGQQGAPPSSISMSSWTSPHDNNNNGDFRRPQRGYRTGASGRGTYQPFNANNLTPWKLDVSAKGHIEKEKITMHLVNCSLEHDDMTGSIAGSSRFKTRGSLAVWKSPGIATGGPGQPVGSKSPFARRTALAHRAALAGEASPSVTEILLFPDNQDSFHRVSESSRMIQYDYAFDVSEDSKVDAITFSVGASHPMLNGGSMVTTVLESIYAYGSITARENASLDPIERRQKRNILRHLPAIDFTFGVHNGYIPIESNSYTDDGQTKTLPAVDGARIMVRFIGGIEHKQHHEDFAGHAIYNDHQGDGLTVNAEAPVEEGIKVVADIGVSSIVLNSETSCGEFPELEIYEGTKLRSFTSAKLGGNVTCHLKPQELSSILNPAGPNIFNPLEAYEIDFSGSNLSACIRESTMSLGHRRVIIPTETTVKIKVVESVVDMTMEGQSELELLWDFQGLSPILQVTDVGLEPESVNPEKKEQVSLLIAPLRQGRLNLHISSVGGISITKAATSREDKDGLYDWKFFNALVSSNPDQESTERLMDVIHDKRTMSKMLQVSKLVNADVYKVLNFVLTRVWRLKEIMDQEEISDPKHIIPGHRMARLLSLLLCGDLSQTPAFLQIIRRVVAGDGLDVVKVKELLRQNVDFYDDWTPEIDRAVRWLETMFAPTTVPPCYVEDHVTPLVEQEKYCSRFRDLPSAAEIYEQIHDRPDLPMTSSLSNLVARIAPYLSFRQISYFLKVRSSKDWQPSDLKRLRYVYAVKRKVMDMAEAYGGLSFLPQSFLVSVFLGEATRASLNSKSSVFEKRPPRTLISNEPSTLASLRRRRARLQDPSSVKVQDVSADAKYMTPAAKVASSSNFLAYGVGEQVLHRDHSRVSPGGTEIHSQYELGDCLLGPSDVATLLQAGLTSVMKGSSVVQLNQRMLLDLVAGQPKSFAVAVLAEIGTPGKFVELNGLRPITFHTCDFALCVEECLADTFDIEEAILLFLPLFSREFTFIATPLQVDKGHRDSSPLL
jgi:hypothetical protein